MVNSRDPESVEFLKSEIARLKGGGFTPEELQQICHNLPESDYAAFCDGCDAYQRKMFGKCRSDTLRDHPVPIFDIDVESPEDSE